MGTLQKRSESVMAQKNTGTMSKWPNQYIRGTYPTHLVRSKDCYVYDSDNNRYIDFIGGLGVNIIGYNHPKVVEAVKKQAEEAVSLSLAHPLEIEVAEMVVDMVPAIEKVRFLKTGSEACNAAVRIARAHSGASVVHSEGYHGWADMFTQMTEPARGCCKNCPIEKLTPESNPSVIITEPIELDVSASRKKHLQSLKGIVIYDEVVTGFRVPQYTVSRWWDLDPDLTVLGKGLASGYPLALVGGKKELMDIPDYFISSTYSGEAVSLAAAKATLSVMKTKSMKDLWYYSNKFMERFNDIMKEHDVVIQGYGTRGMLDNTNPNVQIFMEQACKAGMLFGKAFFYSYAHMESNLDETILSNISDISSKMRQGLELEGLTPENVFKRGKDD